MLPQYCHRLPCVFSFLVLLQITVSRSLQFPDSLSDKRNSPRESKNVYDRGIRDENGPTSSRPPGCCTPELHLGFDNATTDLLDDNHDIPRAQSRVGSIADAPCGNFANLNVEVVQFNSAKFAKVVDAITVSVWVNLQNISGIQPILLIKGQTRELRFEIAQGHVTWLYFDKSPSRATFALLSLKPVVAPYMWTHIVAQYDTRRNRALVFVNGKEILQGESNGEPLEIAWSEFTTVGKHSISEALGFKLSGYIDEFYIYYCALSEMVIHKLHQMCHIDSHCAPIRPDGFCGPDEQPYAVQERCVACFCMGRSQNCSSANLYRDRLEMQLKTESTRLVDKNGSDVSGITYTADPLNNVVVAYNMSKGTQYYWTLPKKLLGNKLSSYGGKLRYTVRYHSGNRSTDRSAKNTSRYLRSLREVLNSRGFVASYNIDDVRDEETRDIDASGIDDPSLGDLDEVTSAPNTPSANSRVTAVASSSTYFSTEINKEKFGSKVESQQTVYQVNNFNHFTAESPTTPSHTVFSSSKKPRTPQQPTIDGKAIYTTGKITSMATASPDEDIELAINQDNKHTGRALSTAAAKPEHPTTAATTATTTIPATSSTAKDDFTNGDYDTTTFLVSPSSRTDGPTSETTSTVPDASFTAPDPFTDGKDEETRFVSSSDYTTDSLESEAMTTIPQTSTLIWDESTDGQDETNIAYTTDTLILKTVQVPDTFQPTSNTFTDGQSEATMFQPISAYSTIPVKSIDGQDETTTSEPSSAHSIEKPTSDAVATIPGKYYVTTDTDSNYATTTFAPSSVYTTERPPETVTTIPDLLNTSRGTVANTQDKTTFAEPSSAHSIYRATSHPETTIPDTFPATTDSPSDGEDETTTTKPSSAQPAKRTPSDTVTTIPNTHYTTTDTSTDVEDAETTFVVPSSVLSTEIHTSDKGITVSDKFFTATDTSTTAGQDKTTTTELLSNYSTESSTFPTRTTIPNTLHTTTDAFPDNQDETTPTEYPSVYSSEKLTSEKVTTMPDTFHTTIGAADNKDEKTTVSPPSAYSTERPTSETSVPATSFPLSSSTDGRDETSTTEALSVYSTDKSTIPKGSTIPDMPRTTKDAFTNTQDETSTAYHSSVYSSEKLTSGTLATIPETFHTTTEASIDDQDEKTTFGPSSAFSIEKATSEILTSVPASSSPVSSLTDGRDDASSTESLSVYSTDKPTILKGTTIPDVPRTSKDAFTDGEDETTTADHSAVYSSEQLTSGTLTTIPEKFHTTREASIDDQEEKATFVPSSAYSTEKATSVLASSSSVSSSTDGRDDVSTTGPPPVFNTPTRTIPPGTTIPGTFYTTKDPFTDGEDEKTTAEPPSAYNTNVPSSRTVTTIPSTHTKTDAAADNQDDTTTPEPPSAYSTDKPTSGEVTKSKTLYITTATSTDGDDETTITEPPSAFSIDKPTSGALTTKSDTLYTTTDTSTDGESEITTTEPFPSNSAEKHLSETMTTGTSTSSVTTTSVTTTRSKTTATSEVATSDVTTTTAAVTQTTITPSPTPVHVPEAVRLVGKKRTLVFYPEEPPNSKGYQTTVEVSLTEAKWRLSDGKPASRDTFMSVLSDVQAIYVRALYGDGPSATSLSIKDISFDVASPHNMGFGQALLVEQCECPVGYSGLSCEYCSPGYTRSSDVTRCTECACNEHSDICDQEKGTCLDCSHKTEGLHCDRCQSGYFGNALKGTPTDCQPCPCPLTIPPNQFSSTCFLDDDGLPTCDACPEGYAGRNCELCSVNFTGNPMIRHSKCELATEVAELKTCDSRGSLNFQADNRAQKCLCKPNVGGESCGTCKPGFFNLQADNPQGCTPCFCNGVSDSCQSAPLNRTEIRSTFSENKLLNFTLVTFELSPVNSSELFVNPLTKDLTFQSFVVEGVQNKILYWKLPREYAGNKVTSYGGNLSHVISFVASSDGQLISAPDIVLVGKYITLYHFKETSVENNEEYTYQVKLYEPSWTDSNGQEISRDQFIMALHKVEAILIRASYNTRMLQTTLREVSMDIATNDPTNQSRVTSVEQCACPLEYQGFSCESCKPGYYRSHVGPYLWKCIKCDCHGHSRDNYCDPETGECKNCQHNTGGFRCQNCLTGFYGNATIGKPSDCKPCPCPMTSPPNRFSPTCFLAEDGKPTCDACPPGYGGRRCDRCIQPYVGNPTDQGGNCELEVDCGCDVRGSLNNSCDPVTRQCFCKKHVEGRTCDKCKRSFFNLQSDEPEGCVPCFCFGLTSDCKCANYYKDTIRLRVALIDGPNFLRLSDLSRNTIIGSGFQVEGDPGHYVYDRFNELPAATYYWFLGQEFRGDMVTSYDGIMRYTLSHEMKPGGELTTDTDVELRGRGIVLIFRHRRQLEGGKEGSFGLKLSEGWLRYPDGSRVTRDIVMTVLSAVDSILVRATYSTTTTKASLYAVSLETGVPQETRFAGKAKKIEDCACPPEYAGTSCQRCGRGYTRSYRGPDFSPCIACSCNQHSKECDPERGQCRRCSHNTTGSQCERCEVGFYGDATQGTPIDCQPCPCPLTIASNQFSRFCKVESDGKPTCTACQTGYSGRTCDRCAKGYAGDPTKPGQKCVKLPAGFMPTVKIRPMKRIKTEGEDATFYCFAGGKGLPRTTWSRQNGKPLSSRAVVSGKVLLIRRVRKEDEGTYECTARNAYGFDTATSQLTVKALRVDPITVSVSPKVLRVPLNQTAQFTCRAKSTTDYQLKWTRGMYGALPEGAESEKGVLTIKFTQSIHGGTYTCTGKNAFNEDMVTVQLRVGVTRPQVFVSPASLSVREGDSAQFRCSASGFPAPVLQWHGGPGGRLPPEARSSNGNGLLTFDTVKKIHEGEYFCTASNLGGISSTGTFLNVSAPGSAPVISVTPITLTVLEGEQALFECTARGDPTPTIRWSRENGRLPQFSSSENGLMSIFPTNLEDGGAYVCTAANAIGANGVLVTLTVERDTSVPPTAVISPTNQTVDEGASVFLTCQVSGDPYPSIEWKKVGDELTDNHVISNGLLQIQEATKEDEGMYVCIAQNKKGVKQATSIVNVRSQVMPKIEIMPAKKLTVTGGDTVVFRCVVKAGNPPPAVVWEREENKTLNSSNDGVLVISPASGDSQGKYICKATNVMGSTEAVALLIVQGEPNIIVSPSSPVSVTAGSTVILECAAAGDPPPSVQWIAPEDSRSNLQQVESRPGLFKLIIEDARPSDQGTYTCQARNLVGAARESVQLTVTVAHEAPEVGLVSFSETVIEGEKAEFRCEASGTPTPIITWERLGLDLPKGALSRNGLLIIQSAGPEDAGTYICKAVNSEGDDSANVQLEVIVPPQVEVTPFQLAVNLGSSFRLFCLVRPPLPVKWSKVNGSIPSGSKQDKGTFTVDLVEVEHTGKYRCHASNAAGSSEGFTSVTVFAAPQVAVFPKAFVASPGSNVSFHCNASGIPDPVITWTKEGMILPRRHLFASDILTLTGLVGLDEGRYLCTATNAAGFSQKAVTLAVEDLPSVAITGGASVKTVSLGGSLTLECRGTGIPKPQIKWSRVGSSLPEGIVVEGGVLVITNAQHSHGGAYACNVTNRVGSVQSQVAIFVQEAPKVTVTPRKSRMKIGEPAELTCIVSGSPSPQLTWWKLNGSLPVNSTVRAGVLRIANVTQEDAGIYFCEASNVEGTAVGNGTLEIKVTVPKFTQQPLSYLSLPTLTKEPLNFTVEIVFAPELANGLILYNDQLTKNSVGDFISFGMSDGFAEFRFNLGFEPAIIRSQQPLRRFEWHTVILTRDEKVGNLTVDNKPPVTGISKGGSTGLNLNQNLFVGGVPDFSSISSSSGFESGFVGCLSYLVIDGKVAKLSDPIDRVGLEDCDVCATRPCKNGGSCREVTGTWGFVCSCRPGYSGRTCQGAGQRCSPGVCNEGRCENVGEDGFKCICPAGYSGERCEEGTLIDTPMFGGNSFMSFPGIEGAVQQLKLSIRFMVQKSGNMLLLYNGQRRYPKQGDFISLAVIGGKVVFKFNLGSGPGIVRSSRNITVGMWHSVLVERVRDRSSLTLDSDPTVTDYSPCCLKGLNLALDMFIGGVENFTVIDTRKVGVNTGLVGCISAVSVDDREINLIKSNLKLRDIKQCTECLLPCEIKPCLNNATCIPIGKTSYVCSCAQGYTGRHCEYTMVGPEQNKTCLNNGIAFPSSGRICACRLGYGGERCESFVRLGDSASLSGDGYLQFPGTLMRGPRVVKPDYMSLEIKTDAQNGVILWQGQRRDHFAIGLREGFLEFRFELGSGPAVLLSSLPVNDRQWHTVEVFRSYREGSLKVDDSEPVNGTSVEGSLGLNIKGPILIGGGDNVVQTTNSKFDTGFTGCVRRVYFKSRKINLQADASLGWNVLPCDTKVTET